MSSTAINLVNTNNHVAFYIALGILALVYLFTKIKQALNES